MTDFRKGDNTKFVLFFLSNLCSRLNWVGIFITGSEKERVRERMREICQVITLNILLQGKSVKKTRKVMEIDRIN